MSTLASNMKDTFLLLTILLAVSECRADVKFVDFKKIDPAGRWAGQRQFLLDNLPYYDHWSKDWAYEVPRDSLIGGLKSCLQLFGALRTDVAETDLLLGEIAHYLYNLGQQQYYDTAEAFYLKAIEAGKGDCRGYWFLGYHYAQSNEPAKAVSSFNSALKLVDTGTPNEFWQEYGFAMYTAGLPSHAMYGLDVQGPGTLSFQDPWG
jgi:tetratricopeptide (TPR) repeat protein